MPAPRTTGRRIEVAGWARMEEGRVREGMYDVIMGDSTYRGRLVSEDSCKRCVILELG